MRDQRSRHASEGDLASSFALPSEEDGMKISVIIPAYNAALFLPRCLASVYAQTLQPHEVIVVDDGSSDDSAEIARKLGATVVVRPNGGLSAARNTGISHATGDWIALLDADDLWSPDKLELQIKRVSEQTVLVYTGIRIFDDTRVREEREATEVTKAIDMLRYCNPITPSTVLVRRAAVMRDGGFREDIRACEDWDMWVRLKAFGHFEAVTAPLTDYYLHAASLSANPEKMLSAFYRILDTTLTADLHGFDRWIWGRRIHATQLNSAALIARDNAVSGELSYMLRSLLAWPSPLWMPMRYVRLAVSVRNLLLKREKSRIGG